MEEQIEKDVGILQVTTRTLKVSRIRMEAVAVFEHKVTMLKACVGCRV